MEAERIPVLAEGAALCREFGLDPLGTIASGALLLALAPADAGILLHALAREGIEAAFIGRVVPREAGVVLTRGGQPGRRCPASTRTRSRACSRERRARASPARAGTRVRV